MFYNINVISNNKIFQGITSELPKETLSRKVSVEMWKSRLVQIYSVLFKIAFSHLSLGKSLIQVCNIRGAIIPCLLLYWNRDTDYQELRIFARDIAMLIEYSERDLELVQQCVSQVKLDQKIQDKNRIKRLTDRKLLPYSHQSSFTLFLDCRVPHILILQAVQTSFLNLMTRIQSMIRTWQKILSFNSFFCATILFMLSFLFSDLISFK